MLTISIMEIFLEIGSLSGGGCDIILINMTNVILFIMLILLWMFTWFFSGLLNNYYG
ncbi:hypothetical protein EK56_004434 [Salmonella enterica subsp. enterica]|nr:hypothetical protein [Salmonella enterica subsp. enterica serovar Abony]